MFKRIEDFLLDKFAGKVIARAGVTVAGAVVAAMAGPQAQAALGKLAAHGVSVSVDPGELAAGIIALGHAAFEAFKAWRRKGAAPAPAAGA